MIIELEAAKALLGVTGTADDDTITAMLNAITWMFEREAHRKIEDATVTQLMNGSGTAQLFLQEVPREITSVHVSSTQTWDATSLVDAGDYSFDHTQLFLYDGSAWTQGWKNVQVVFESGFEDVEADAPDVWWAAQKTIQKMWSTLRGEQGEDLDITESITKNGLKRDFRDPSFLDDEVKAILLRIAPWQE